MSGGEARVPYSPTRCDAQGEAGIPTAASTAADVFRVRAKGAGDTAQLPGEGEEGEGDRPHQEPERPPREPLHGPRSLVISPDSPVNTDNKRRTLVMEE
jgi:hypothetical protein